MNSVYRADLILADLPYEKTACDWDHQINITHLWQHYKRIIKEDGVICLFSQQPFASVLISNCTVPFKYELIWDKGKGSNPFLAKKRPMISHENLLIFYNKQPTYNPQMRPGKPYKAPRTGGAHSSRTLGGDGKQGSFKQLDNNDGLLYPLSILPYSIHCGSKLHPVQKPEDLCRWLIRTYTNPGDTILDNCCGVGTSCLAALKENRRFIGIEIDPKYFRESQKAIESHQTTNPTNTS